MSKYNTKNPILWADLPDTSRFLVSKEDAPDGQKDRTLTKAELKRGVLDGTDVALSAVAAVNPAATNDSGQGYSVGSSWVNTVTDEAFTCVDATVGAAVWKSTTSSGGNNYHDLAGYYPGVLAASGVVLYFVSVRAMTILASSPGRAKAKTAAAASTVFTIKKNGVSVGTFNFAAAATSATFTVASDIVLADSDTLTVEGPATADTALADVAVSLKATAA